MSALDDYFNSIPNQSSGVGNPLDAYFGGQPQSPYKTASTLGSGTPQVNLPKTGPFSLQAMGGQQPSGPLVAWANPSQPAQSSTPFSPVPKPGAVEYLKNKAIDIGGGLVTGGATPEELRSKEFWTNFLNVNPQFNPLQGNFQAFQEGGPIGIFENAPKLAGQIVKHPLESAGSAASGVGAGLMDIFGSIVSNLAPEHQREVIQLATQEAINKYFSGPKEKHMPELYEGFRQAGEAAPFIAAGGIAGDFLGEAGGAVLGRTGAATGTDLATGAARNLGRAALGKTAGQVGGNILGFTGTGQLMVPREATMKQRADQLVNDLVGLGLFEAGSRTLRGVKNLALETIKGRDAGLGLSIKDVSPKLENLENIAKEAKTYEEFEAEVRDELAANPNDVAVIKAAGFDTLRDLYDRVKSSQTLEIAPGGEISSKPNEVPSEGQVINNPAIDNSFPREYIDNSSPDVKEAYQFYSPNIEDGQITFNDAVRRMNSENQARYKSIGDDIDKQLNLQSESKTAIGDTKEWGSENTVFNTIHNAPDYETVRYSAALKGMAGNQKAVIPFMADINGADSVYRFSIETSKASMEQLRTALDEAGLEFRTFIPSKGSTEVVVFDPGTSLESNVKAIVKQYGTKATRTRGRGEFLGGDTRAAGLKAYRGVIDEYRRGLDRGVSATAGNGLPDYRNGEAIGGTTQGPGVSDLADFIVGTRDDIRRLQQAEGELFNRVEKNAINEPYKPLEVREKPIPRGEEAILERLRLEQKFEGLPKDEVDTISRFIDEIGPSLFDDVGMSIRGRGSKYGQFDYGKKLVTLFRQNIMESGALDRTTIHEFWHTLSRYLPDADVNVVKRDFINERDAYIKKNPWFNEVIKNPKGLTLEQRNAFIEKYGREVSQYLRPAEGTMGEGNWEWQWGKDNYRFKNIDEWFSETLTDKTFERFATMDKITKSIFAHAKEVFRGFIRGIQRFFGYDQANRILEDFTGGKNLEMQREGNLGGTMEANRLEDTGGGDVPEFIKKKIEQMKDQDKPALTEDDKKQISSVEKLRRSIQSAVEKRPEIEAGYSQERSRRSAVLEEIFSKYEGEESYKKALGALKGELLDEKPQFTPPREKLSQEDVTGLFQSIRDHSPFENYTKVAAMDGLKTLLSGDIPQPKQLVLLEEVFGKDLIVDILKKGGVGEGFWSKFVDVANIPRALMASMDFSAPLRQGIFNIPRHPVIAAKSFAKGFKDMFSPKDYEAFFEEVKSDPLWQVARDAGLDITNMYKSKGITGKEEAYKTDIIERIANSKIPGVKHLAKLIVGSERGYTGFLNRMRWDTFKSLYENFKADGVTDKQTVQALADFINVGTGRGKLPGKVENAANVLNAAFFSPKLIMSRLTLFNPYWYYKMPRAIRVEALKTWLSFLGTGAAILTLAKMGGADVEDDPRSSDFGKIRVGDTRWDIWGGMQPYVTLTARMMSGERKTGAGDIVHLSSKVYNGSTRLDVLMNFMRSKLAPVPGAVVDTLAGKNVVGEDVDPMYLASNNFIPLWMQDTYSAWQKMGPDALLYAGAPAFFGVGTQTYEAGQTEQAQNILKEMSKMTPDEAKARFTQIAKENPKLADAIKKRFKEMSKGYNDDDRFLKSMSVEDRAKEIVKKIKSFETEEEKKAYFEDMVKKGIITKDTVKAIISIMKPEAVTEEQPTATPLP